MTNHNLEGKLKLELSDLASVEMTNAIRNHGHFKNEHEGSSVLFEEIEEVVEAVDLVREEYRLLWKCVRDNASVVERAKLLEIEALAMAYEALQVVAVARKLQFLDDKEAD